MALKKPRSLAPVPLLWTRQSWIPQVMFMGHHDPWGRFNGCPCGAVTWPIYIYIYLYTVYKCGYLHRMGWHTINSIVNGREWRHFEWFTGFRIDLITNGIGNCIINILDEFSETIFLFLSFTRDCYTLLFCKRKKKDIIRQNNTESIITN